MLLKDGLEFLATAYFVCLRVGTHGFNCNFQIHLRPHFKNTAQRVFVTAVGLYIPSIKLLRNARQRMNSLAVGVRLGPGISCNTFGPVYLSSKRLLLGAGARLALCQ